MPLTCNVQVLLNKLKSKRKRIIFHTQPHTNELQVLNGEELLEKHLSEGPSNAQYTSRFSARLLIEAS